MALPSGYRELAYIKSSGTQYIDTGFKPNNNTRVVMDVQAIGTSGTYFLFGARESNRSKSFCFFYYEGWSADYQSNEQRQTVAGINYTDLMHIDFNKATCTVNEKSVSFTDATFQCPVKMPLLAVNTNGEISGMISAKLFACKIYDNGTLVRDFVPAKRTSDDTVGLYDIANGVFYTNAGTGTFVGVIKTGPVDGVGASIVQATSYGIVGGKTIVDGTAYDITEGKTLVGGTGYDILFLKGGTITIKVDCSDADGADYAVVTINGKAYKYGSFTSPITLDLSGGTVISCKVAGSIGRVKGKVILNGNTILDEYAGGTYDYVVNGNAEIIIKTDYVIQFKKYYYYGEIAITEK